MWKIISKMHKNLIQTIITLGISPIPSWKSLNDTEEEKGKTFLMNYLYPFLGATTISVFLGTFFHKKGTILEIALKESILIFVSLFCAFFLSSYILNKVNVRFFEQKDNLLKTQMFVGYISSIAYVIKMIQALLPELFFVNFAMYYILYIIWTGSEHFMDIQSNKRLYYLIVSSVILYIIPIIMEKIMVFLMPGLS